MKIQRSKIEDFIQGAVWASRQNIVYLFQEKWSRDFYIKYASPVLEQMANRKTDPLRRIHNTSTTGYTYYKSPRKALPEDRYRHDNQLRNVLAVIFRENQGDLQISNKMKADAKFNEFYIEFDRGTKNDRQLEDQLKRYKAVGKFRVLYIMAHKQNRKDLESERIEKIQRLVGKHFSDKPSKVLMTTYNFFLENRKVFNFRAEDKTNLLFEKKLFEL